MTQLTIYVSLVALCLALIVLNGFVIGMFLRRQRELEELALIEATERREYLAQASSRMAAQTDQIRRVEYGLNREEEFDHASVGNRRMREVAR